MPRRRPLLLVVMLAAGAAVAAEPPAGTGDELAIHRTRAAALANDLGARLKQELVSAMQAGGPLAAVSVCRDRAAPIADSVAAASGWEVGRTSLRVRNPDNAPDSWERAGMEAMAARAAGGAPAAGLVHEGVVRVGEHRYYRYLQAIPTAEVCTLCHGESLSPELAAHIGALYPDDRATGFRVGDLRGAFTVTGRIEP